MKPSGIIKVTPMLGAFGSRYPHTLLVTVMNDELAGKLVTSFEDNLKDKTSRERKKEFKKILYYLPDEMCDHVARLEDRQN